MTMNSERYERSSENPNGLFEAILDPSFMDKVPELERRLSIATADIQVYLTDVVGVDKDMAGVVAVRATQEILAAAGVNLEEEEKVAIFIEADRLANPQ